MSSGEESSTVHSPETRESMELIAIGKLGKPYGTAGALRCFIDPVYGAVFQSAEFVFLKLDGHAVPFFIVAVQGDTQALEVQIEGVDNREAAQQLAGKAMYLRPEDIGQNLVNPAPDQGLYADWIGCHLKDQSLGDIGPITAFETLPQQVLAIVDYQGRPIMIPFQESLIIDMDLAQQTIVMDLPEGLLDL